MRKTFNPFNIQLDSHALALALAEGSIRLEPVDPADVMAAIRAIVPKLNPGEAFVMTLDWNGGKYAMISTAPLPPPKRYQGTDVYDVPLEHEREKTLKGGGGSTVS